jgi:hypothetical protein
VANLTDLINSIQEILQDRTTYTDEILKGKINTVVNKIAAGIRMPDKQVSPPLPDLYKYQTISTTLLAYVALPVDYQRKLFQVHDSSGYRISCPRGGDYYSFNRFMRQISNLTLTETGDVYIVCVKGLNLYYQGIPATAKVLGLHYYRKPVAMTADTDEPDGLPEHLQVDLIKHGVIKEIFGEAIEDGQDNTGIGTKYHTAKFYEAMTDLIDYIGIDSGPIYYGNDEVQDAGACDG